MPYHSFPVENTTDCRRGWRISKVLSRTAGVDGITTFKLESWRKHRLRVLRDETW